MQTSVSVRVDPKAAEARRLADGRVTVRSRRQIEQLKAAAKFRKENGLSPMKGSK